MEEGWGEEIAGLLHWEVAWRLQTLPVRHNGEWCVPHGRVAAMRQRRRKHAIWAEHLMKWINDQTDDPPEWPRWAFKPW